MSAVVILGAGTFAVEVLEAIELAGQHTPVGFLVSAGYPVPHDHCGLPVATLDDAVWRPEEVRVVGGIVTTARRGFVTDVERRGFQFVTIAHPAAIVSPRAALGAGCFVGAGAIVASHTVLADHVLVNRGANVGHNVTVGRFATVGPGVTIAGSVTIGTGAYLGVGAVLRDHVAIGEGSVVAAGAVVVKSLPDHVLAAGCPAAVIKKGVDGL